MKFRGRRDRAMCRKRDVADMAGFRVACLFSLPWQRWWALPFLPLFEGGWWEALPFLPRAVEVIGGLKAAANRVLGWSSVVRLVQEDQADVLPVYHAEAGRSDEQNRTFP